MIVLVQALSASVVNVGVTLGPQAVIVVVEAVSVGTGESQMARQEGVGAISRAQLLQSMREVAVVPAIGAQQAIPSGKIVVVQLADTVLAAVRPTKAARRAVKIILMVWVFVDEGSNVSC